MKSTKLNQLQLNLMAVTCVVAQPPYYYPQPQQSDEGYHYNRPNAVADFTSSSRTFTQPQQVFRHVYVHVAPEETEEHHQRQQLPIPPPQKHYKIIFIKAPSPPSYSVPVVPVQPQSEEKTLVYVLVKKPEAPEDLVIPTAAPTQPSKPEVYFIKYQTKKEHKEESDSVVVDSASRSGLSTKYGPP